MLLVPTGIENLLLSCRHVSSPLFVWCCLHTVAAEPVQQLMSMCFLLGLPSVVLLALWMLRSRGLRLLLLLLTLLLVPVVLEIVCPSAQGML